jgi:hypothetical protein
MSLPYAQIWVNDLHFLLILGSKFLITVGWLVGLKVLLFNLVIFHEVVRFSRMLRIDSCPG